MKAILKDIASIQMGYSFRSRLESKESGNVAVIQMKDLMDNNTVDLSNLISIENENFSENHYVKKGDLIFRSRGLTATSAIVADNPDTAVLSAPLLRIRVAKPDIIPEYLNWFIRQLPAQAFLASHAKGTTQKMISKEALGALEVIIPSLEKQKAIVALAGLAEKEQSILKNLAIKRKQYISAILIRKAQEKN